jgi:hypothetical protein
MISAITRAMPTASFDMLVRIYDPGFQETDQPFLTLVARDWLPEVEHDGSDVRRGSRRRRREFPPKTGVLPPQIGNSIP